MQMMTEPSTPNRAMHKRSKPRKWREIEEVKARLRLTKELHDIDQSFDFSLADLL